MINIIFNYINSNKMILRAKKEEDDEDVVKKKTFDEDCDDNDEGMEVYLILISMKNFYFFIKKICLYNTF